MSGGIDIPIDVEYMAVTRALTELAGATGKPLAQVIRQNARLIAVNLAYQTQPFGDSKHAKAQGEWAVGSNIARVYATPQRIYGEIKEARVQGNRTAENLARAFYRAVKRGDRAKAEGIMRASGIPQRGLQVRKFDGGEAHQRRRNGRGRIAGKYASMVVTDPEKVQKYSKQITARVGQAKGGWAHVARGLGGTRGIPQFVTRHKKRVNGTLTDNTTDSHEPHVIMSNTTPWIRKVLNFRQELEALRMQREKMLAHVRKVVEAIARKAEARANRSA